VKSRFHRFSDLDNRILVDRDIQGASPMPTRDGFNPDNPLDLFLADERRHQGIGKAWDGPIVSSRVIKASILVATLTAIGIAFLSGGDPATFFADVAASMVDKSTSRPDTDQSTPTIQSTADAQALPAIEKDASQRDELAAAPESVGQSQMENNEPSSEALFRQFQAWAAAKDAQAQAGPVQSVQAGPIQVAENTRAPLRPTPKRERLRPFHSARAEIRPAQNPRRKVRREQNARVKDAPAQEAQAQDQSVQNAQVPSFLPTLSTFGWRN
jgi:hypothetical protein